MKQIKYEAKFSIKLRNVVEAVKELEDSINDSMKNFGLDDKLSTETELLTASIIVGYELSAEEEHKMKVLLESQVIKQMPQYDIRLSSFSRQSEQSVSQSAE